MNEISIIFIVVILLVLIYFLIIYFSNCRKQEKNNEILLLGYGERVNNLNSYLSQNAIKRFKTTGGAGICQSLSDYYDPISGKCKQRPKMTYGSLYGGGSCHFDSQCKNGVCDRFGECHCGPGFSVLL